MKSEEREKLAALLRAKAMEAMTPSRRRQEAVWGEHSPQPSLLTKNRPPSMGNTQASWMGRPPMGPSPTPWGPEPVAPIVTSPPMRKWRLVMWDGKDRTFDLCISGMNIGLQIDGETIPANDRRSRDVSPASSVGVTLSGTVQNPSEIAHQLTKLTGRDWSASEVNQRAAAASAPPQTEDLLVKALGPRIDGPWQIVVGSDVRVVRHGFCPATHLPAYSTQTKKRAKRLVGKSTALGYDGSSRIAPELCVELTLDGLKAYSDRLAAMDTGVKMCSTIDAETLLATVREAALRLASTPEGRARMIDQGIEPPDLEPTSMELQIASSTCDWTVLHPSQYFAWASGRGLVNPYRLDERVFPGCSRALHYAEGYTALFYPDHVRVGRPSIGAM